MIDDGRHVDAADAITTDVCIIGSGPAGLTIADHLGRGGARVLLLERGADAPAAPPELDVTSPHFLWPATTLNRQLGGMAPIWNSFLFDGSTPAARYLPLDEIDFESRYWVPDSGWPFARAHLAPFYERAWRVCGVEPVDFDERPSDPERPTLTEPSSVLRTRFDQLAPAKVFTEGLLGAIRRSPQVHVLSHSAATAVVHGAEGDERSTVIVATGGGRTFVVTARVVVLAGGAIENARLLLASTAEQAEGLGNRHDNVGRYLMDHPRIELGRGAFPTGRDMRRYGLHTSGPNLVVGKLSLAPEILRREEMLNGNAQIYPQYLDVEALGSMRAARNLVRALKDGQFGAVPQYALAAARHAAPVGAFAVAARYRPRPGMPLPGHDRWDGVVARAYKLSYQPEQAPTRANRVTLGERRDEDGQRVAHVTWRWSNLDVASIRKAREQFSGALAAAGLGPMVDHDRGSLPSAADTGGSPTTAHHHLGTTRMADDPRRGVVDREGRVHGCGRVFVAGGSVFPTGGYANPTLTVIALAVRLADTLGRHLGIPRAGG